MEISSAFISSHNHSYLRLQLNDIQGQIFFNVFIERTIIILIKNTLEFPLNYPLVLHNIYKVID